MPLRSICCLILWNDVQVKMQKSSQVLLLLSFFPCPVLQSVWRCVGADHCPWGVGSCHPPSRRGPWDRGEAGRRGEAGCCQQLPLFSDLLGLKVAHSLAFWGISFEASFPSLPEAGFRPPPCFSFTILWITVSID